MILKFYLCLLLIVRSLKSYLTSLCLDFLKYKVKLMRIIIVTTWVSLVAQLVKNLPAMWETWVQSLGWEDPLEKGKATHCSILA